MFHYTNEATYLYFHFEDFSPSIEENAPRYCSRLSHKYIVVLLHKTLGIIDDSWFECLFTASPDISDGPDILPSICCSLTQFLLYHDIKAVRIKGPGDASRVTATAGLI